MNATMSPGLIRGRPQPGALRDSGFPEAIVADAFRQGANAGTLPTIMGHVGVCNFPYRKPTTTTL
jgi:hypothetical protein